MKSLLHKLNIFKKNKNIKKIKQKLKNIDDKNDKAKEIEQQKRAKTESFEFNSLTMRVFSKNMLQILEISIFNVV